MTTLKQLKELKQPTEPFKVGQKVKTDAGKTGEISHVRQSNDPKFPHNYKVTDLEANDPYKQTRLENGNFIPHNRLTPIKESRGHKIVTDKLKTIDARNNQSALPPGRKTIAQLAQERLEALQKKKENENI